MYIMKTHSTMKPRDAMTFLLVVTLFTNLARHDLGTVSALSDAEKRNFSSKRRFLQRMIRLKLTSSTHQSTSKKVHPSVTENSYRIHRNASNDLFEWFLSNYLPNKDAVNAMDASNGFTLTNDHNGIKLSLMKAEQLHNSSETKKLLLYHQDNQAFKQSELTSPRERTQFRRHASLPASEGKGRSKRKKEAQLKRENKKKKRNKEKKKKKRKMSKRMKELIEEEAFVMHTIDGEDFFDCCPSKIIVVEKLVGKDRKNHAVDVRPSHQYFYERICLPGIEDQECVFPNRSLRKNTKTRCAQQYSYVQANVRPYRSEGDWHVDYIHVRSGCSCQVSVASPKRRKKKNKTLPQD